MATARCAANIDPPPLLHMQASPEGRVKRHLLLFPPAAAENNQAETKKQRQHKDGAKRLVPRGASHSEHARSLCTHTHTHCFVLSIKVTGPSILDALRCSEK